MNREIRRIVFRGKSIDTGEWVYGDLLQCKNGDYAIMVSNSLGRDVLIREPVYSATVSQYTGLKDRNGKEIYEGDIIVQQGYSGMRPMLVRFDSGAFITGSHKGSSTPKRPMLIQPRCKIIGNIHDNPELLEDRK